MTAGAPRAVISRPDQQRRAHTQAVEIHALLARNVPHRDVAAAVGCTEARVREVATQPAPAPLDDQPAPTLPAPRAGTEQPPAARTGGQHPSWDTTLNRAARHTDRRITALAAHIRADLGDLLVLLSVAEQRDQATAALLAADRRAEAVRRVHDQRHPGRRRTDHLEETA